MTPAPDDDQTQGCIGTAAYVPPAMIGVFAGVGGLSVLVLLACLIIACWLRSQKRSLAPDTVPQSVDEKVLLAARDHAAVSPQPRQQAYLLAPRTTARSTG